MGTMGKGRDITTDGYLYCAEPPKGCGQRKHITEFREDKWYKSESFRMSDGSIGRMPKVFVTTQEPDGSWVDHYRPWSYCKACWRRNYGAKGNEAYEERPIKVDLSQYPPEVIADLRRAGHLPPAEVQPYREPTDEEIAGLNKNQKGTKK